MSEEIVITWDEWKASRAKKRAVLASYGLDTPSRRSSGHDHQLRSRFNGERAPQFESLGKPPHHQIKRG